SLTPHFTNHQSSPPHVLGKSRICPSGCWNFDLPGGFWFLRAGRNRNRHY
ncbi:hypothetical protein LINPERHAP1_LOCUS30357, partial [Linum perenne]